MKNKGTVKTKQKEGERCYAEENSFMGLLYFFVCHDRYPNGQRANGRACHCIRASL